MIIDRAVVEQALEVLEEYAPQHGRPDDMMAAITAFRSALAREDEPMRRAIQDAVTAGVGIMRGGERIDPASIYKWSDLKTLPSLPPKAESA